MTQQFQCYPRKTRKWYNQQHSLQQHLQEQNSGMTINGRPDKYAVKFPYNRTVLKCLNPPNIMLTEEIKVAV